MTDPSVGPYFPPGCRITFAIVACGKVKDFKLSQVLWASAFVDGGVKITEANKS